MHRMAFDRAFECSRSDHFSVQVRRRNHMVKLDLKRKFRYLYNPTPKQPALVNVPEMNFIMIDGEGDPNTSQQYQDALSVLYSVAYTLKFMLKKSELAIEYPVMPLEGLWWADDVVQFCMTNKDALKWTMMIMQPEFVTDHHVQQAIEQVGRKRDLPTLSLLRFESFAEGLSAQIMHLGSYADEAPTIQRLHVFIPENGYELHGKHHEVYLSDPHKIAPARLKTIIRQPVA